MLVLVKFGNVIVEYDAEEYTVDFFNWLGQQEETEIVGYKYKGGK